MENDKVLYSKSFQSSPEDQQLTFEEIWDDSVIDAQYDQSLNMARNLLASKLQKVSTVSDSDCSVNLNRSNPKTMNGYIPANKSKKKKKGKKKNQWHTGDPCRAHYSEDGQIYEATIIDLNQAEGTCTVRYIGYNNEEDVAIGSLITSQGSEARSQQMFNAEHESEDENETEDSLSSVSEDRKYKKARRNRSFQPSSMPPPHTAGSSSKISQSPFSLPHLPDLPPPPALGLIDGDDPISSEALHTMLMSWYMTGYHTGYYQGLSHGRKSTKR